MPWQPLNPHLLSRFPSVPLFGVAMYCREIPTEWVWRAGHSIDDGGRLQEVQGELDQLKNGGGAADGE